MNTEKKESKPVRAINVAKPVIGKEEKDAVSAVLESGMLAQGPRVKEFEEKFAAYCGAKHAIAANSGTAALHMALYASGIRQGDEVITTPFTFVATANSIIMQGAKPVFVDIDPETFNIDPEKVKAAVTKKTKAILPVDLYGRPFDYEKIREIADKNDLAVVEDACQAVGAETGGKRAGCLGNASAFSLYATKNMMSGEGGVMTTDDDEAAEMARRFRHHGQSEKTRYEYHDLGYNYRMMDIQAAIAIAQMDRIDGFNSKRIKNAEMLTRGLSGIKGIKTPAPSRKGETQVFHQYTIRITGDFPLSRDEFIAAMKEKGVNCAVFYPKPLHLHPHFARLGHKEGDFPECEKAAKEVVSLPVHPSLCDGEIEYIIEAIREISG